VRDRGETVPLDHPEYGHVADVIGMGVPIRFSDASVGSERPAPAVGQDNGLVYGDWLEYGGARVEALRAAGVI
jgi:crotonobetainyl-CoA:carnitine CoA-transferase CaiB-like acyl-CoA transferase